MKAILVVDDEIHIRRIIKLALEDAGYSVHLASDGLEALEAMVWSDFDAIVTDIMMPRMTGKDFCFAIKERFPDLGIPILVMTSRPEEEHRDWAKEIPCASFLEKPISARVLLQRLHEVLAGEKPE